MMRVTQPTRAWAGATLATAFLVDQLSKWTILEFVMQPPRVIEILPVLNLTLGFNEGTSFGMFAGLLSGRPMLAAALTGALTLVFALWALRSRTVPEAIAFALIAGGATGNVLDRIRQGAVTDFLDLHLQGWHWPTFNLADVAITLGALLLVAGWLRQAGLREKSHG